MDFVLVPLLLTLNYDLLTVRCFIYPIYLVFISFAARENIIQMNKVSKSWIKWIKLDKENCEIDCDTFFKTCTQYH